MALDRDAPYQALLERLRDRVPGVVTWSRRHLAFAKLPASAQPACLVLVSSQDSTSEMGAPTVWTLGVDVVLLVRSTGQEETLDTVLNNLVDQVEAALLRDPTDLHTGPFMETDRVHTTLGGLIHDLTVAGPVEFNQAEGGEQATVVIPIDMVVLGDG